MDATEPVPEAKLYGLRYLLGHLQSLGDTASRDPSLMDQLHLLALMEQTSGRRKSQLGQDVFALAMSGFRRGGYFIEVGAHDGVGLSNTWLLETGYGWNGLLVEPHPAHMATFEARKAQLVTKAAWNRTGEKLEFRATADAALSSIASVVHSDKHDRSSFKTLSVDTVTLDDLFTQYGAPSLIDYISIDVEGSELEVLNGLSLDKWNVQAFSLEHNNDAHRIHEFDRRLMPHGYVRAFEVISDFDAYFVKRECLEAWRKRNEIAGGV